MSIVSTIFSRNTVKLVAALAIPGSIVFFFYYAEQQANQELEKYKHEQSQHKTSEATNIKDFRMKEVDDSNRLRWQLVARQGLMMANGQDVELHHVTVEYYDALTKALKMRLTAPLGNANQITHYVKLKSDDKGRVIADGEAGKSHFTCGEVELTKKNQFVATGGVIIEWPGVAKVSGNSASGTTNMAAGPKDMKVVGNAHAEIAVR